MIPRNVLIGAALLVCAAGPSMRALAQTSAVKECDINALQICALHVLQDEYKIVTSPLHVSRNDLLWIAPFAAGTGYTLTQDASILQDLGSNPTQEKHFNTASNIIGIYAPAAYAGVGFIAGHIKNDDHLRETSLLVTEAGVDSLILNTGLQYAVDRQDPKQGNHKGDFWPHGTKTWSDGTSMP